MKNRILVGTFLFSLFVVLTYFSEFLFFFLVLAFSLLAIYEFSHLVFARNKKIITILLAISHFLIIFFYFASFKKQIFVFAFMLPSLYFSLATVLFDIDALKESSLMLGGHLYLTLPMLFAIWLRHFGPEFIFYPAFMVFIYDTGAFLGGSWFGKHKLAPKLSPKKTIEGVIIGYIVAIIYGILWPGLDLKIKLVTSLVLPGMAQLGDLFESSIKRKAGKKDSSNIFGAHGGALDRLDSLIFAFATFFLIVKLAGYR